ncbi:unnamed protein product [Rotaria sp. Silwood2]|nr:unnamed protein product [Rotaria sp. Silwood2]CAF2936090.1 unnamed protein product [Rotaria sp. Silwood2]CAF3314327.1 unnamed protein product [Rotaria sp. Silwood2]CAF3903097.1 unnamed protein product [Rotaria sp. Silwood2]CAF3989809.1 unnamed protein product [Rotaria sp. Silwood2]
MSKHEVILLKEKITVHIDRHPFESTSLIQSSDIDKLDGTSSIRLELYQQYTNAAKQIRSNMMTSYAEFAEREQQESQEQFDIAMKEFWDKDKRLPANRKLTTQMCHTIEQRLTNISTRAESLYKYKTQLLHLQPNQH